MWNVIYKTALGVLAVMLIAGIGLAYRKPMMERQMLLSRKAELAQAVQQQQTRLDEFKVRQDRLQTDSRFVEKLAREEFGYAKADETVFKFEGGAAPVRRQ